jgi:hypothetical protein
MTPQEKAKELRLKFYIKLQVITRAQAKQCALIAVDEIQNMCKLYHNHNVVIDTKIYTELTIDYWQEVKQELQKL